MICPDHISEMCIGGANILLINIFGQEKIEVQVYPYWLQLQCLVEFHCNPIALSTFFRASISWLTLISLPHASNPSRVSRRS